MSSLYIFIATKTTADVALPTQARDQGEYNRRVSNAFRAQSGGRLTVGDLKLRPNGHAILNHLLCDGSAVSRTSFPELFALLGTSEGAGDGSTTFNIPNYLGASLEVPSSAPSQTVSGGGTVNSGGTVTAPTGSGQTGGTSGGNVVSGGRPGSTASTGGTAANDTSLTLFSTATLQPVSNDLIVVVGDGGAVTLLADIIVTTDAIAPLGTFPFFVQWQWDSTGNGAWVAVGDEDSGFVDYPTADTPPGEYALNLGALKTPLTPGSSHKFRLAARNESVARVMRVSGTARATGS